MDILGIETTCDETAIAIVRDGKTILANEIASQAALHAPYGGVFPELASREHLDQFLPLTQKALDVAGLSQEEIDLIAVAQGPGLMGSLLMGIAGAQALAFGWDKPLIGINHVEAHLYSALMDSKAKALFPALGVVLSGGHTFLSLIDSPTKYTLLGTTVDDAVGEAFDKVASLLGLPYPGGIAIENLAEEGDPYRYPFKAGKVKGRPLDFSFSGLKTNVFYTVKGNQGNKTTPSRFLPEDKKDIAASFQHAAFTDIAAKIKRAESLFSCQAIYLGGGVTANKALRTYLLKENLRSPLYWPPRELTGDNGAMIAGLAFHRHSQDQEVELSPFPRLPSLKKTRARV